MLTKSSNEDAWLLARTAGMGGSDIAAIITGYMAPKDRTGCVRHSLPAIWAQKAEPPAVPPVDPRTFQRSKQEMDRGNILEGYVAKLFEAETGFVTADAGLEWHAKHKHVFGSIDRLVIGTPYGCEIKTRRSTRGWGKSGTSRVPVDVDVQCRVYMEVYNLDKMFIVVAFGLDDIRIYELERDSDVGDRIMRVAEAWWNEHVIGGRMPEVDGSDETRAVLDMLGRHADDHLAKDAEDEDRELLVEYHAAAKEMKAVKSRVETLKNRIRSKMLDADELRGVATWQRVERKGGLDMESMLRDHPEIVEKYQVPSSTYKKLAVIGEREDG